MKAFVSKYIVLLFVAIIGAITYLYLQLKNQNQ